MTRFNSGIAKTLIDGILESNHIHAKEQVNGNHSAYTFKSYGDALECKIFLSASDYAITIRNPFGILVECLKSYYDTESGDFLTTINAAVAVVKGASAIYKAQIA